LTSFVDNHDVKSGCSGIKLLDDATQGHDPYRYCIPTFTHEASDFSPQLRRSFARAAPNPSNRVGPSDERLPLAKTDALSLRRPRLAVNQFCRRATKLSSQPLKLPFKVLKGQLLSPVKLVM
jgi:hypothetical protein